MWFEDLFGFAEQSPAQVRKNLSIEGTRLTSLANNKSFDCGTLEIPTLADLRISAAKQRKRLQRERNNVECRLLANVQDLHTATENQHGNMFKFASQFNLLEMAVAGCQCLRDGVGIYQYDYTQGPACAQLRQAQEQYFATIWFRLNHQTGQTTEPVKSTASVKSENHLTMNPNSCGTCKMDMHLASRTWAKHLIG